MAASKVKQLESRLQALEKILFGGQADDVDYPKVYSFQSIILLSDFDIHYCS